MRRLSCVILSAALLACTVPAVAADRCGDPLQIGELLAWAETCRVSGEASTPWNTPGEDARNELGYMFVYDFGILYYDSPVLTAESRLQAVEIFDPSVSEGPRGTGVDMSAAEILNIFYTENEQLSGTERSALLYSLDDLPEGAAFATVDREGHRMNTIAYTCADQRSYGDEGYTLASLIYTLQDENVVSILVTGLDSCVSEAEVRRLLAENAELAGQRAYTPVRLVTDGSQAAVFMEEDLTFAGMDLASLTPEGAARVLGTPIAEERLDDDGGATILNISYDLCDLTFLCPADGADPVLYMLEITSPGMEGPRAVSLGDTISSVIRRFRFGEGGFDGQTDTLYGIPGEVPWGMTEYYEDGSAVTRYAAALTDGRTAVLMVVTDAMEVSQVLVYID